MVNPIYSDYIIISLPLLSSAYIHSIEISRGTGLNDNVHNRTLQTHLQVGDYEQHREAGGVESGDGLSIITTLFRRPPE